MVEVTTMKQRTFLLSVDLEDLRMRYKDGANFLPDNIEFLTQKILVFLKLSKVQITFFTLGELADAYPDLIRRIVDEGHEIAWHSYAHTPLPTMNAETFRIDLEKSLQAFRKAGVQTVNGFRAPYFSLTKECAWVYEVLAKHGFQYSSSVLPARNQLYAWGDFGEEQRKIHGIWELPMTTANFGLTRLPFAGGAYLRSLPMSLVSYLFRRKMEDAEAILSYFHPYDLDTEQKKVSFPDAHLNRVTNFFLFYNRDAMLRRLGKLIQKDVHVMPYRDYVLFLGNGRNTLTRQSKEY